MTTRGEQIATEARRLVGCGMSAPGDQDLRCGERAAYCERCQVLGELASEVDLLRRDGARRIAAERERHHEMWGDSHDDDHDGGAIAEAALAYIDDYLRGPHIVGAPEVRWPWQPDEWKPCPDDPIRQLVKAGALIAAEIDRLERYDVAPEFKWPRSAEVPR